MKNFTTLNKKYPITYNYQIDVTTLLVCASTNLHALDEVRGLVSVAAARAAEPFLRQLAPAGRG
jgi:hypothetical protein